MVLQTEPITFPHGSNSESEKKMETELTEKGLSGLCLQESKNQNHS